MALVKCPECGKESISDAAATCPSCGYGIKEHFDLIRQKETFDEEKRKKQERLQNELEKELEKIDVMPRPYKPSLSSFLFDKTNWPVLLFGFFALIWLLLAVLYILIGEAEGIICLFVGGFLGVFTYVNGKNIKADYDRALDKYENWDRYKERLKNDTVERYEKWISDLKKQKFEVQKSSVPVETVPTPQSTHIFKCPKCGSINVKRISNTSRAISVELMGLASSKIGKQYECKDCKHMW